MAPLSFLPLHNKLALRFAMLLLQHRNVRFPTQPSWWHFLDWMFDFVTSISRKVLQHISGLFIFHFLQTKGEGVFGQCSSRVSPSQGHFKLYNTGALSWLYSSVLRRQPHLSLHSLATPSPSAAVGPAAAQSTTETQHLGMGIRCCVNVFPVLGRHHWHTEMGQLRSTAV